jgi:hypothetical protein
LNYQAEGRFWAESNQLYAEWVLLAGPPDNRNITLTMTGGFYDDDYLQFTYRSKDPIRKQMGVLVLRLSEVPDTLSGHYAGFSPLRGKFVVGTVKVHSKTSR